MNEKTTFERLSAVIESERSRLSAAGDWPTAAFKALFIEEVWTSTGLGGSSLTRPEVAALLDRGVAVGERPLEEYVLVADYAAAARYVRGTPPASGRRRFLHVQEVVDLHALVVRRDPRDLPGTWRTKTIAPFSNGMVAPPAWVVPQTIAAFVERLAPGPPLETAPLLWVAHSHEVFERIHPFATANGRVGRLIANILLRRLGLPPLIFSKREAPRYLAALARADSGNPWPLATVIARSVFGGLTRLAAAANASDTLHPLAELAGGIERAALYKAAQRGTLRTVRRDGALLTSRAWIDAYRAEPARYGRRRTGGAATQSNRPADGDDLGDQRAL